MLIAFGVVKSIKTDLPGYFAKHTFTIVAWLSYECLILFTCKRPEFTTLISFLLGVLVSSAYSLLSAWCRVLALPTLRITPGYTTGCGNRFLAGDA
jgi:hypothetical protein